MNWSFARKTNEFTHRVASSAPRLHIGQAEEGHEEPIFTWDRHQYVSQ